MKSEHSHSNQNYTVCANAQLFHNVNSSIFTFIHLNGTIELTLEWWYRARTPSCSLSLFCSLTFARRSRRCSSNRWRLFNDRVLYLFHCIWLHVFSFVDCGAVFSFAICFQRNSTVRWPRKKLRLHNLISIFNVSSYYHVFCAPHSTDLLSSKMKSSMTSHDLTSVDSLIIVSRMVWKGKSQAQNYLVICIKIEHQRPNNRCYHKSSSIYVRSKCSGLVVRLFVVTSKLAKANKLHWRRLTILRFFCWPLNTSLSFFFLARRKRAALPCAAFTSILCVRT